VARVIFNSIITLSLQCEAEKILNGIHRKKRA
jgi:hypothetical protein